MVANIPNNHIYIHINAYG